MRRFILTLAALLTITLSASAMSYAQARDQALFLTDKMAYELNLTDEQYEAAYEINLDYLMRIDNYDDLYGVYWRQRNLDLSYILLDWQYRAYCDAAYFYRPLYWDGGFWHFGVYARYPNRDYFFFGCPDFVVTYHGGHSWYYNGGHSWYYGRPWHGPRDHGPNPGMRARFDNGHYGPGYRYEPGRRTWSGGPRNGNGMPGNGNVKPANNGSRPNGNTGNRTFGNLNRGQQSNSPLRNNRSFGSQNNSGSKAPSAPSTNGSRSFGSPRQSSTRTTVSQPSVNRSFGGHSASGSSTPSRTFTPQNNGGRTFGTSPSRSSITPMRSVAPSSSSRSTGGNSFGGHSSSGSFGGGHTGGGTSGGHFGRR